MLTSQTTERRQAFLLAVVLGALLTLSSSAFAYDNDTHFWLTYYLARKAGYTHIQSMQIASADVSVDVDNETRPVTPSPVGIGRTIYYFNNMQHIHADLHALPWMEAIFPVIPDREAWSPYALTGSVLQDRSDGFVAIRKKAYWREVWDNGENPGTFLHYLQDSYAHQYFMSLIGHAAWEGVDFISSDKDKAKRMARMTLRYMIAFKRRTPGAAAPDPESMDLDTALGAQTMAEVDAMIDAFANANNMPSRNPNSIKTAWDRIWPQILKKSDKASFVAIVHALWSTRSSHNVPNSFNARQEVVRALQLNDPAGVPEIWLYDLKSDATPELPGKTRRYLIYLATQPPVPADGFVRSEYEGRNKQLIQNSPRCLAFKLAPDDQSEAKCE